MNDEQLRKFCLEQSVKLYESRKEPSGLISHESISILEITKILFDYIKDGEIEKLPFSVSLLT